MRGMNERPRLTLWPSHGAVLIDFLNLELRKPSCFKKNRESFAHGQFQAKFSLKLVQKIAIKERASCKTLSDWAKNSQLKSLLSYLESPVQFCTFLTFLTFSGSFLSFSSFWILSHIQNRAESNPFRSNTYESDEMEPDFCILLIEIQI